MCRQTSSVVAESFSVGVGMIMVAKQPIREVSIRKRPISGMGRRGWLWVTLLTIAAVPSHALMTPTAMSISTSISVASLPSSSSTQLRMIGKVFGGGGSGDKKDEQLPKDIKDAISKCREAVQQGLEDRLSRMVSLLQL
jgi:hypothetical protein